MVNASIGPVDNQIVPVGKLVREAAREHSADDAVLRNEAAVQHPLRGCALDPLHAKLALHGPDDVSPLADVSEPQLEIVRQLPFAAADRLGKSHRFELLEPPCPERMPEWV